MKKLAQTLLIAAAFLAPHFIAPTHTARADEAGFYQWMDGFKRRALATGIAPHTLDAMLQDTTYRARVIELDRAQPEGTRTFAQYIEGTVSPARIKKGREMMAQYRPLLNQISAHYGVPPQYIVALWGIETNYGGYTGGFDTLSALATLAYEGRRAEFFEGELINALHIMAQGHSNGARLTGSWAGAMGQNQFMPTSYLKYAVDWDHDGKKDIWNNLPDVFASIANYLKTEGWQGDMRWGRAVRIPSTITPEMLGRDKMRPMSYWRSIGVTLPNGAPLPYLSDGRDPQAGLIAPDGITGPSPRVYLVYNNYNVIMHWNRSTYFATSVGLLADAIQ